MMLLRLQFCHLESMGESRKVFEKLVLLAIVTGRCQKIGLLPVGSVSTSPQIYLFEIKAVRKIGT